MQNTENDWVTHKRENIYLNCIYAMNSAGYKGGCEYLRNWADQMILKCRHPQVWLCDLSCARTTESASWALSKCGHENGGMTVGSTESFYMEFGILYHQLETNQISLDCIGDYWFETMYALQDSGKLTHEILKEKFHKHFMTVQSIVEYLESDIFFGEQKHWLEQKMYD
jgi:hypothetical protein